jgi:protein SCO1/2
VRTAVAAGGIVTALALALGARAMRPRPSLPVYGHVPAFRLVDQRGEPYTEGAMIGHVSVVDFVFTRCTASCPLLTSHMAELQGRLEHARSGARLLSFSVDPEHDTPPVLAAYAARAHADAARWTFVTGPADDVSRAVVLGFKVAATKVAKGAADYEVMHGDWFVLVDAKGDFRGYYPMDDPGETDVLVSDVLRLESEAK